MNSTTIHSHISSSTGWIRLRVDHIQQYQDNVSIRNRIVEIPPWTCYQGKYEFLGDQIHQASSHSYNLKNVFYFFNKLINGYFVNCPYIYMTCLLLKKVTGLIKFVFYVFFRRVVDFLAILPSISRKDRINRYILSCPGKERQEIIVIFCGSPHWCNLLRRL